MAAIDFPNSPLLNDTHTSGGRTWLYDGEKWVISPSSISLDDLSDVDTSTNAPAVGDVLTYNGTQWVSASIQTGGGLATSDIDGGNQLLDDILDADVTNWPVILFNGGTL